jgi:hypothetical protein
MVLRANRDTRLYVDRPGRRPTQLRQAPPRRRDANGWWRAMRRTGNGSRILGNKRADRVKRALPFPDASSDRPNEATLVQRASRLSDRRGQPGSSIDRSQVAGARGTGATAILHRYVQDSQQPESRPAVSQRRLVPRAPMYPNHGRPTNRQKELVASYFDNLNLRERTREIDGFA